MSRSSIVAAWAKRHPDLLALVLVWLVAAALRAAFLVRAPVFVTGDSESYLGPAFELARGLGFDLSLKRTPAYPGFVALVIGAWGEDLRALALAQHILGILTAVLTFVLGRLAFGWGVGLAAGLLTALNGALVLVGQTAMTEALFVPLVLGALTALVAALRTGRLPLYALAGLLLGAATLTRPVAQALVPLVPLAVLLVERHWRPTLVFSAVALGAFVVTLAPWVLRSASEQDSASVGSLGQTLVGRTARHDRGQFVYYDPVVHDAEPDPYRLQARRVLQQAAENGSSGKAIHTRLRRELGLSVAETDRLMRDLAIEAIQRRPDYYLQGTLQRFIRLSLGSVERLPAYQNTSDVARQRWEDPETRHLLAPTSVAEQRAAPAAGTLVSIYQPGYLGALLPLLAIAGLAITLVRGTTRPAAILGLAALVLLFTSAALVGNVARYRFPEDPLLAVLACGAIAAVADAVRRAIRRRKVAQGRVSRLTENAEDKPPRYDSAPRGSASPIGDARP